MNLPTAVRDVLFDPVTGRLILLAVGLVVLFGLRRVVAAALTRSMEDKTTRYRTRKFVSFATCVLTILFVGSVFSDRLGGLTVAFGVAGAGVAFALQEVIASVAGRSRAGSRSRSARSTESATASCSAASRATSSTSACCGPPYSSSAIGYAATCTTVA